MPINTKTTIIRRYEQYRLMDARETNSISRRKKQKRAIVLNGGGKDSAILAEVLQKDNRIKATLFTSSPTPAHDFVAKQSNLDFIFSMRKPCDLLEKNAKLSGHLPLNFYLLILASLIAYIKGYDYVITANESSANESNIIIDNININHQYSKSSQFENDLNFLFKKCNIPIVLFSGLGAFSEIQLCKTFSMLKKYHKGFVSCNNGIYSNYWCKKCEKCIFVISSMFLFNKKSAELIWGSVANFFDDNTKKTLLNMINPNQKPLECIGTTSENFYLITQLIEKKFLVLNPNEKKVFDIYSDYIKDKNYDIKTIFASRQKQNNLSKDIITIVNNISENYFTIS